MDKQLSKEEMDALLNPSTAKTPNRRSTDSAPPMLYDFRRPDRVSKEMLQAMQLLHDKFATNLSASFSGYLRTFTEVVLRSVDQTTYSDFLDGLPAATYFSAISMHPLKRTAAIQFDLELAFALIDRLTGGSGGAPTDISHRKITDLEKLIVEDIIGVVVAGLEETWQPVNGVTFKLAASETRPQLLHITRSTDTVIIIAVDLKIEQVHGALQVCIPYGALEPIKDKFEKDKTPEDESQRAEPKKIFARLLHVPIELMAELPPTKILLRDLLEISAGDVITLASKIGESVDMKVGGIPSFQAQLVKSDGQRAVRLVCRTENVNRSR
jgi:flagellar motor switch protein FliM